MVLIKMDPTYLHVRGICCLHRDFADGWDDVVGVQNTAQILRRDGDGELEDSLFLLVGQLQPLQSFNKHRSELSSKQR